MELAEYLYRYGWSRADSDRAAVAFHAEIQPCYKARRAAESVAWMDDSKHDYSGEMLDCVCGWMAEQLESAQSPPPSLDMGVTFISPLGLPG